MRLQGIFPGIYIILFIGPCIVNSQWHLSHLAIGQPGIPSAAIPTHYSPSEIYPITGQNAYQRDIAYLGVHPGFDHQHSPALRSPLLGRFSHANAGTSENYIIGGHAQDLQRSSSLNQLETPRHIQNPPSSQLHFRNSLSQPNVANDLRSNSLGNRLAEETQRPILGSRGQISVLESLQRSSGLNQLETPGLSLQRSSGLDQLEPSGLESLQRTSIIDFGNQPQSQLHLRDDINQPRFVNDLRAGSNRLSEVSLDQTSSRIPVGGLPIPSGIPPFLRDIQGQLSATSPTFFGNLENSALSSTGGDLSHIRNRLTSLDPTHGTPSSQLGQSAGFSMPPTTQPLSASIENHSSALRQTSTGSLSNLEENLSRVDLLSVLGGQSPFGSSGRNQFPSFAENIADQTSGNFIAQGPAASALGSFPHSTHSSSLGNHLLNQRADGLIRGDNFAAFRASQPSIELNRNSQANTMFPHSSTSMPSFVSTQERSSFDATHPVQNSWF